MTGAFYYFMNEIKKPNTYWLHVGDLFNDHRTTTRKALAIINNEGRGSKLSDDDCLDMDFWDRKLIPGLKKIANKCLGVVRGNHYKQYGNNDTNIDYVCRQAGLKVLGEHRGYLTLRIQRGECRRELKTFITHGSGGNAKNDMGKLKDQSASENASIIFGGHTHRLSTDISAYRRVHKSGIETHARIYVRCGAMRFTGLAGVETYDDLADYGALPVGMSVLEIIPTKKDTGNLEIRANPTLMPFNFL